MTVTRHTLTDPDTKKCIAWAMTQGEKVIEMDPDTENELNCYDILIPVTHSHQFSKKYIGTKDKEFYRALVEIYLPKRGEDEDLIFTETIIKI